MKQLAVLLVLLPFISISQINQSVRYVSDIVDPTMINSELFYASKYKEIAGSPYLEKEMYQGDLILKNDKRIKNVMIRYNAYEDAVLYRIDANQMTMIDPPLINGFEYQKKDKIIAYISISFLEGKPHFYEVIYMDRTTLVVQHRIKLKEKTNNAGSYGANDMQGSAFKQSDSYFLMNWTGNFLEVKLSKKSLLPALGSHQEELQTFIKNNQLKLKDYNDLVRLLKYFDSLD